MNDIIVTTPKRERANAAQEAADVLANGAGFYFRAFRSLPPELVPGESRVYYVEDGFIRGYAVVCRMSRTADEAAICDTTGRIWDGRVTVYMDATSWVWVKPVPFRGFQSWRIFRLRDQMEEVGGWRDPKPEVTL